MNYPLILIIVLLCGSCGKRAEKSNHGKIDASNISVKRHWTMGVPEVSGEVPEIHLLLSTRGVEMSPSYSIDGRNWVATLLAAKNMNPKPYLVVSVGKEVPNNTRDEYLLEISRTYECVTYKCFYR